MSGADNENSSNKFELDDIVTDLVSEISSSGPQPSNSTPDDASKIQQSLRQAGVGLDTRNNVDSPRQCMIEEIFAVEPAVPSGWSPASQSRWEEIAGSELAGQLQCHGLLKDGASTEIIGLMDKKTGQKLTAKSLKREHSDNEQVRNRFMERAEIASRLHHYNIVSFDKRALPETTTPFRLLEYIEGRDLREVISQKLLSGELTTDVFSQVCGGLAQAHVRGILHGNLEPGKIMITRAGRSQIWVKLLGFGERKQSESRRTEKQYPERHRALYMSPEQHEQGRAIDARSDIYSLGCIMYECLAGRPPFQADSLEELIEAKQHVRSRNLADVTENSCPTRLALVVRKCIEANPDERYQSILNLRDDLILVGAGDEPNLSSAKLTCPVDLDLKTIGDREEKGLAQTLTSVMEGSLSVRNSVKTVLELILEIAYPGYSILRLESRNPDYAGTIVFRSGYQIVSAKILGSKIHGYEALRKLFSMAAGQYQYLTVTQEKVRIPNANLCLNLNTVLSHYPDLPEDHSELMSYASLIDIIFEEPGTDSSSADNSDWQELPIEDLAGTGASGYLGVIDEESQKWVEIDEDNQEITSTYSHNPELEQLVTGHRMRADVDSFEHSRAMKAGAKNRKLYLLVVLLVVLAVIAVVIFKH